MVVPAGEWRAADLRPADGVLRAVPELNDGPSYSDVVKPPSPPSVGFSVSGKGRAGGKLLYNHQPWREPDVPYTLEVLYEDDDILAVNSPSGRQVLPAGLFQQRTVLMQLQWCKKLMSSSVCPAKPSEQETHAIPVHRLGRGTSGSLI